MTTSRDVLRILADDLMARQPELETLDLYLAGEQPVAYLSPEVLARVGNRLASVVINWPRIVLGAVEERLDVTGFRVADGGGTADDKLWTWWQANNLDEWSQLAHADALLHGRAFVSVWGNEDQPQPTIACESARQMTVLYRAGSSEIDAALKLWVEGDLTSMAPASDVTTHAVLYLPDRVEFYAAGGSVATGIDFDWKADGAALDNPLGEVPIVPLVNRPRLTDLTGESEIADIIPPADSVNKLATDMMVSSEYHAQPRRWATGIEVPREGEAKGRFTEEVRRYLTEAFPGRPWVAGKDVKFGQFTEAQLENFVRAMTHLQSQVAALGSLPPHYVGLNTDNPASADAIRSAEASLVQKAMRKQKWFGGGWERAMRLAQAVDLGQATTDLDRLETIWRDPATPTPAQKADAVVKLTQVDRPIITMRQAREDLGYSPEQIDRMERDEAALQATAATSQVQAQVDMARQLMAEDGLSQQAAYAAVGLIVASQQMSTDTPTPTPPSRTA